MDRIFSTCRWSRRRTSAVRTIGGWLGIIVSGWAWAASEEPAAAPAAPESLVGSQVDVTLANGQTLANIQVLKVRAGKAEGSILSVTVPDPASGKPVLLGAVKIREITAPGGRPIVVYDAAKRMLVPPGQATAGSARPGQQGDTSARLALSDVEQKAAVEKQRAFLKEMSEKVPNRGMQLQETKRFLFACDVSSPLVNTVCVPYLDTMYTRLCGAYGIDPNINIWNGKATIIVFADKVNFQTFETTFFQPADERTAGLCHGRSNGEVVISCHATSDPKTLAVILVHETAHGFAHRYFANHRLPSWLNEGIAEWVANVSVVGNTQIPLKVQHSTQLLRQSHSLGGEFFTASRISFDHYGAAASLVDFLLAYNPKAVPAKSKTRRVEATPTSFRQFLAGIRAGTPWEQSLHEAYGLTTTELALLYGQTIGLADLRP
jgi:hypothetical protein